MCSSYRESSNGQQIPDGGIRQQHCTKHDKGWLCMVANNNGGYYNFENIHVLVQIDTLHIFILRL
uniref:Uncharacterized protein n=1 Tax=Arion vulgaris TaxID=1028688 RepID=A0A0B6ZXM1_9EUPU